jgi:hypothetical protein
MFDVLAQGHPDAMDALLALKSKIEENPSAAHRCIQPMGKNYPECHGRIWKYDWAPPSVRGSSRKSWRLVVYVADAKCSPIKLVAMACYSKNDTDQLSLRELAAHMKSVQQPAVVLSQKPIDSPSISN